MGWTKSSIPRVRKTVSASVRKAIAGRPDDWFLVTCRFQGYFDEGVPLGPKFVVFHVRPLDDWRELDRFVRDWFHAAYGSCFVRGGAEGEPRPTATNCWRSSRCTAYQAGHIRELCTNPLLLTILCIVFHEERKLPTGPR